MNVLLLDHDTLHARRHTTHSSYLDFPALFQQSCSTPGSYLCSDRYFCEIEVNPSLIAAFPDVFRSMGGVTARSTCTWNPFPIDGHRGSGDCPGTIQYGFQNSVFVNNTCVPVGRFNVTPSGYCALVGPPNPKYSPDNCPRAATGSGVTGYFDSNVKACYTSTLSQFCVNSKECGCNNCDACFKGRSTYLNWNAQKISSDNDGMVSTFHSDRCLSFLRCDKYVALSLSHNSLRPRQRTEYTFTFTGAWSVGI